MSPYATIDQVNEALDFTDVTQREIDRASEDWDLYMKQPDRPGSIWSLDPLRITNKQRRALVLAVADQVEYIREMGREFFIRDQLPEVQTDGFSRKGKISPWSPRGKQRLIDAGLVNHVGRMGSGYGRENSCPALEPWECSGKWMLW